jgi:GTPase SAR1 family protein
MTAARRRPPVDEEFGRGMKEVSQLSKPNQPGQEQEMWIEQLKYNCDKVFRIQNLGEMRR